FNDVSGLLVFAFMERFVGVIGFVPFFRFGGVGLSLLHPEALAIGKGFAFPERRPGLQRVNNKFACTRSVASVGTGYGDEDYLLLMVKLAIAVHRYQVGHFPA